MSDITSPKEYIEYYKKIIFPIRTIRKKLQSLLEANNNHSKNTAEKLSLSLKEKIMNTLSWWLIQDFVDTMAILANEREKENPDIITSKEREMRERIVNNILPFWYDLSSKLFELASEKNQYDEKNIIQITKKSVGSKNREFLGIIADWVWPLWLVLFWDTLRPNKKIKVTEKEKIKCHIRISLFKKYLGLGWCEKILKNSDYEPTIKKSENTKYYDFSEEYKSEIIWKLKARYPSFDKLVKTTNKKKEIPLWKKNTPHASW